MFLHFLITRFNIRITGYGPERMTSHHADEEWLRERLFFFKTYCVPAVISQSNKDFKWLIYFDSLTPIPILDEVIQLKANIPNVEIILTDHYDDFITDIKLKINTVPEPFVISSRLDNDDLISTTFIQSVQNAFVPVHNTILNFNAGYELSLSKNVLRRWNNSYHNQFTSIIENTKETNLFTIYGFPHWRPPASSHTINIITKPQWIYLIHGNNYSEPPGKGIPVFFKPNLSVFPEVIRKNKLSMLHTFRYAAKWFPTVVMRRMKNIFIPAK